MYENNTSLRSEKSFQSIELLLSKHPKILAELFDSHQARLKASADLILDQCRGFSSGEILLLRICLDLWNGSGNVKLCEIWNTLDSDNFERFVLSIGYLYYSFEKFPATIKPPHFFSV